MSKVFELGKVVVTMPVDALMKEDPKFAKFVQLALGRHANGDWGKLSVEDKQKNDEALITGERILSSYKRPGMQKDEPNARLWIITEADRKSTTILFPEEY